MGFVLFIFGISFTFNIILIIVLYKLKDKLLMKNVIVDEKDYQDFYLDKVSENLKGGVTDNDKEKVPNPFFANK